MPVREQTNAPQDDAACRFYGEGASYAAIAADLSQFEDDVLSDADAIFESSARFNHQTPRTLLFRFPALASTDDGALWRHGTGANTEVLRLRDGGGGLEVLVNNTTVHEYPITEGTLGLLWLAWVSEPNPDPDAGASDAVLSWLFLHSESGGWSERSRFTHAAKASELTTAYVGSTSSGGVNALTEPVNLFGFWSRVVSFTELALMHWAARAAVTTVAGTERQPFPLQSGTTDTQSEVHGAAAQSAAAALSHTRWRCMGALTNQRFQVVPTVTNSTGDGDPKTRAALGTGSYVWPLGWSGAYPVSPTANAVFLRVHARIWATIPGLNTGHWGLRVYVLNRRPVIGQSLGVDPPEALEYRYAEVELADDNSDSDDPGRWRFDVVLPIVRGTSGVSRDRVYIAIAYAVDPTETNLVDDDDLRLEVKACHVVQLFDATEGQPPGGGPSGEAG